MNEIPKDYGCNPLGNGKFEMVPSGDVVSAEEKEIRLRPNGRKPIENDCAGLSWDEIERMQGGKLNKKIK